MINRKIYLLLLLCQPIGIVAEKAGLAAGMASNIVPCVGLIIFTLLVDRKSVV